MTPRSNPIHALARLDAAKRRPTPTTAAIGPVMVGFFKQSVAKRQEKLSVIAQCWQSIVPESMNDHCALESLTKGTLTVVVDSASHLYELKQLLLAGLQEQLLITCRSTGLRKVTLRPGRWYVDGDRRPSF